MIPGSVCVWCGHKNPPPQMRHAESQTDLLKDTGTPDPFSLDIQDSERKDRNHEVFNRMIEAGARQRRRHVERRTRTGNRNGDSEYNFPRPPIPTGELVVAASETPTPRRVVEEAEGEPRLVEVNDEEENLIEFQ